ncbi:MAG: hypothetical protein Q4A11_07345, partial [Brachymonas sp.]|nr:hypothetical protein [Brachymonas sp.]
VLWRMASVCTQQKIVNRLLGLQRLFTPFRKMPCAPKTHSPQYRPPPFNVWMICLTAQATAAVRT